MQTRIYKLYYACSSAVNAAAYATIQAPGVLVSAYAFYRINSATPNAFQVVEVSFANSSQINTNDTLGQIAEFGAGVFLTTSGALNQCGLQQVSDLRVPVRMGDRIYINTTISGTISIGWTVFLSVAQS